MLPNLLMGANGGVAFDYVGASPAVNGGSGGLNINVANTGCLPGDLIIVAAASWTTGPNLLSGFTNVVNGAVTSGTARVQARVRQSGDPTTYSLFPSGSRATAGVYAFRPRSPIQTTLTVSLPSGGTLPQAIRDGVFRGVFRWSYNTGANPVIPSDSSYFDFQNNVNNGNHSHVWTGLRRFAVLAPAYTHGNGQFYYNILTQKA